MINRCECNLILSNKKAWKIQLQIELNKLEKKCFWLGKTDFDMELDKKLNIFVTLLRNECC